MKPNIVLFIKLFFCSNILLASTPILNYSMEVEDYGTVSRPLNTNAKTLLDGHPLTTFSDYHTSDGMGFIVDTEMQSTVHSVKITSSNITQHQPMLFTIWGSNDNINYTELISNGLPIAVNFFHTRYFTNTTSYRYYRFVFSNPQNGSRIILADVQLYGTINSSVPNTGDYGLRFGSSETNLGLKTSSDTAISNTTSDELKEFDLDLYTNEGFQMTDQSVYITNWTGLNYIAALNPSALSYEQALSINNKESSGIKAGFKGVVFKKKDATKFQLKAFDIAYVAENDKSLIIHGYRNNELVISRNVGAIVNSKITPQKTSIIIPDNVGFNNIDAFGIEFDTPLDDAPTTVDFDKTGLGLDNIEIGVAIPNNTPTITNLGINGNLITGEILAASYTFNDLDGDIEFNSNYAWYSSPTGSAPFTFIGDDKQFTLTSNELNKYILFEITTSDRQSSSIIYSSNVIGPVTEPNEIPTISNLAITGENEVGKTLTANYIFNDADGDTETGSSYTWYSSSTGGAPYTSIGNGKQYTLTTNELNKYILFEMRASDGKAFSEIYASTVVGPILPANSAPTITELTITGDLTVHKTLTAEYTFKDIDGDTETGSNYAWYSSPNGSAPFTLIGNNKQYTLTSNEFNKFILFEVVASDGESFSGIYSSAVVGPISPPNSAPTITGLTITGELNVDQTLTAQYTFNDVDGDTESGSNYAWYSSPDGNAPFSLIGDNKQYTLSSNELHKYILFEIVAGDGESFSGIYSSAIVGPIEANTTLGVNNFSKEKILDYRIADGVFSIVSDIDFSNLFLYNTNGQKILKSSHREINIKNYKPGIYYIIINTSKKQYSIKVYFP